MIWFLISNGVDKKQLCKITQDKYIVKYRAHC